LPRPNTALVCLIVGTFIAGLIAGPAAFAEAEFIPIDEFIGEDGQSGDSIYDRVLKNRFDAFQQHINLHSGDAAGNHHDVELRLRYKSYRDDDDEVLSKTIAKYFAPQDVRHLGYLVINKREGQDDQFVYRPSARMVRRVNVRGETIAGTDFAIEDIVPAEMEDGAHFRLADAEVDGIPTYVVTVVPDLDSESEYAKVILYIEKQHYVPIQSLYWDNKRVQIKRLRADPASIEAVERGVGDASEDATKKVWIARKSRMDHLKLGTFTELEVASHEAMPTLRDRHFSQRELTASR
jgi:hypothetical protein